MPSANEQIPKFNIIRQYWQSDIHFMIAYCHLCQNITAIVCQTSLCVAPSTDTLSLSWTSLTSMLTSIPCLHTVKHWHPMIHSNFHVCILWNIGIQWYIPISMFACCQTPQCQRETERLFVSRHSNNNIITDSHNFITRSNTIVCMTLCKQTL